MKRPAVITICATNYLPFARVLRDSLLRFHPEVPLFLVLAGDERPGLMVAEPGFHSVTAAELNLSDLDERRVRYDRKALCASLKPAALKHLLARGFEPAIFLDPDILILDTLDPVFEEVTHYGLTVTPHVRRPEIEGRQAGIEKALLLAGIYNAGFVGVTADPEVHRFLDWWDLRLRTHCRCQIEPGMHYDQRWLDLAPAFVSRFHLLRDEGCNVAYWSVVGAVVTCADGAYRINGMPLRFFHFSGFDPAAPEEVSRFAPGMKICELGPVSELFLRYRDLLRQAGWSDGRRQSRLWPRRRRPPR